MKRRPGVICNDRDASERLKGRWRLEWVDRNRLAHACDLQGFLVVERFHFSADHGWALNGRVHHAIDTGIHAVNGLPGHERFEVAYEKLAAFIIEPGQAAFIDKGTWHNVVALGAECQFINVTRKNPGEGTTDLETEVGTEKAPDARPYIEFLDLKKRDRRVIELEL